MRAADPTAIKARFHLVLGINNYEGPSRHKYKCRAVINGGSLTTATGDAPPASELYSHPMGLSTFRTIMALGLLGLDTEVYSFDVDGAYRVLPGPEARAPHVGGAPTPVLDAEDGWGAPAGGAPGAAGLRRAGRRG